MSKPLLHFGLTPQVAFFPESSDGHAEITVSVAEGGEYLLDMGYLPTGTLDVRRVSANSHPMGTLVMASAGLMDENDLAYSNMVAVKLLKGGARTISSLTRSVFPSRSLPVSPYT